MKGIGEGGDWPANGRKPPTSRGADIQSTVGVFCTVSKNKNTKFDAAYKELPVIVMSPLHV